MIKTRLLKQLGKSSYYILYQIILQWIGLLGQVTVIFGIANLLNNAYQRRSIATEQLLPILLGIIVQLLCSLGYNRVSFLASVNVKKVMRAKIYQKLLSLGASYRDQISSSQVMQMATDNIEQLETYFSRYLSQFAYAFLAPITLFAILIKINAPSSIVLLCAVPLIPIVIMFVMIVARKILDKYFKIYYSLGDTFLEKIQGMTTLKVYQADQRAQEEIATESEHFRKITMKVLTMQLLSTVVMDFVAYGGAAVGIFIALKQMQSGHLNLYGGIILILLAAEYFLPMRRLGSYFHIGMNGMKASDKIFEFLDLKEEKRGTKELSASSNLAFKLQNLSYAYPDEPDQTVLKDISLDIPAKGFVSIVGLSGCGKSTLASLLSGKKRTYKGNITINGIELKNISEDSLLKNITSVGFNSYLFKGTVRDNLIVANEKASDSELISALKEVKLWDFLKNRKRLDTLLEENAGNFSGGQKQRLSIARALLHDSPVYIFDEATSNIDLESEAAIMNVIENIAHTKTVILISHRLANVISSDTIFFMEDGRVTSQGKHSELLRNCPEYSKLFNEQSQLENYTSELTGEK